jgi:hypothetical protein
MTEDEQIKSCVRQIPIIRTRIFANEDLFGAILRINVDKNHPKAITDNIYYIGRKFAFK